MAIPYTHTDNDIVELHDEPMADYGVSYIAEKGKANPLQEQIGGEHYRLPIQPIEYIYRNGLDFIQGNIVKYATRFKKKGGVQDLKKIIHYARLAAKLEYNEEI